VQLSEYSIGLSAIESSHSMPSVDLEIVSRQLHTNMAVLILKSFHNFYYCVLGFYPRDAMLARVFAIATCPSVHLSVCLSHAGIVPSRAKAGS